LPLAIACLLLCASGYGQNIATELREAESIYRAEGAETALPLFMELAATYEELGDEYNLAAAHYFVGASHWRLGNYGESRAFLTSSLSARETLGDLNGQGKTLNVLGLLDWHAGNYDAATAAFEKASAIGRSIGDAKLEGATLNNLSLVLDERGEYRTSLAQYHEVLEIYSRADFPRGVGDTLGNIGGVHLLLGQFHEALNYYQRALQISEELDNSIAMSQDHGNIANAYLGLGEMELALQNYDLAIELSAAAGMGQDHASWLRGKANALIQRGQLDEGLRLHRDALDAYRKIGAQAGLMEAMHDLGALYLSLGDSSNAEQLFNDALHLAASLKHNLGTTINHNALGYLQLRRNRPDKAIEFFERARDRADEKQTTPLQVDALIGLSFSLAALERYADARRVAVKARDISQNIGLRYGLAEAQLAIADSDRLAGNNAAAVDSYRGAKMTLTASGDPDIAWRLHFGHGLALDSLGERAAAIEELQSAVEIIESVRGRLREERFRSGYLQDKDEVYTELVRLQLENGGTDSAFETAERLRARTFVDQVERAQLVELSPDRKRQQAEYRTRIRSLQQLLRTEESLPSPEQRQAALRTFSAELIAAERAYEDFLDDRLSDLGRTVQVPAASDVQARLADDEILLEFVVGTNSVTVFGLSPEGISAISMPIDRAELRARVELLRDLIERADGDVWKKPAQGLSDILISPLQKAHWLAGKKHVYLVPHGILNYLPFAVLSVTPESRSRLMIDDFTIAFLPTAAVLQKAPRSRSDSKGLLAVAPASSRLRYAPQEARSIEAIFEPRSHLLEGASATESELKAVASQFNVLHFATHGYFNLISPMLSGLQLEPDKHEDGLLEVHEVMQMRLNADLVTLSACETGMTGGHFNAIPAGDELVGLTRAFLYAGSESVVATLWEVDDMSSVDVMTRLYRELATTGSLRNTAAALAFAQKTTKQHEHLRHPFYWAPYIFIGPRSIEKQKPIQVPEDSA
jgi:CHAT domain-containing protein/Tfp pilus assembly protein PilF